MSIDKMLIDKILGNLVILSVPTFATILMISLDVDKQIKEENFVSKSFCELNKTERECKKLNVISYNFIN